MAFYSLAGCYEDLGRVELARECYKAALQYQPGYDIFLGGFASFLYLHGEPSEAFDAYLEVLKIYKAKENNDGIERCVTGLKALGEKMGWSEVAVRKRIEEVLH